MPSCCPNCNDKYFKFDIKKPHACACVGEEVVKLKKQVGDLENQVAFLLERINEMATRYAVLPGPPDFCSRSG